MAQQSLGKSIISWETDEYPAHRRSILWYIFMGIIGAALLLYALFTASFMFAVILLMIGAIMIISHLRNPNRIAVHITTNGILVGKDYFSYEEVKNFSIIYQPPQVKRLFIDFDSFYHPMISVSLEDSDPNAVREALLPYVMEDLDRTQEPLTDILARRYKL